MTNKTNLFFIAAFTAILLASPLAANDAFAQQGNGNGNNNAGSLKGQVDANTAAVDSFFDIFTEISNLFSVDSFFDVFTELQATDEDLQSQIDAIPEGPQGSDGTKVIPITIGVQYAFWPDNTVGNDGDTSVVVQQILRGENQEGNVYEKVNGEWVLKGNITGADGQDGATGPAGADGADGATGPAGGFANVYTNSGVPVVITHFTETIARASCNAGDIAIGTSWSSTLAPTGFVIVEDATISGGLATYTVQGYQNPPTTFTPQVICLDLP